MIESGGSDHAATIKSHHNVGGLPEDLEFELVEPLRMLFKDEVRAVGAELGLPERMVWRQPFPGPGLAIRIVGGEVNRERLDILRAADAILQEEIRAAELYRQLWQSFCVLPVVRSVGVQGDGRTYAYPIVIRAVTSDDAMTADWARLPYDLLERVSNRIINEISGRQPRRAGHLLEAAGDDRVGVARSRVGRRCRPSPVSIAILGLVQAALVALPGARRFAWLDALRSPWWALVPALSIVVVIGVVDWTPNRRRALLAGAGRRAAVRGARARLARRGARGPDWAWPLRRSSCSPGRRRARCRRGRGDGASGARLHRPRLAAGLGRRRRAG